MSHAEYAPKRLAVVPRLMLALRKIPVIEFALAKLGVLLGRRTNPEPITTSAFLAPPGDLKHAPVESGAIETIEIESAPADSATVEGAEADVAEITAAKTDLAEGEIAEAVAAEVDQTDVVTAEVNDVAPAAAADNFFGQEPDPREIETPAPTLVPTDTDETTVDASHEIDVVEPAIADLDPVAADTAITDETAPPFTVADERSERELLIRRRWNETGIRMWNPRVHGAGQASLCIQGRVELLPPKAGEIMPQYDRLEFWLLDGLIVCEGFAIEPPAPPKRYS